MYPSIMITFILVSLAPDVVGWLCTENERQENRYPNIMITFILVSLAPDVAGWLPTES